MIFTLGASNSRGGTEVRQLALRWSKSTLSAR